MVIDAIEHVSLDEVFIGPNPAYREVTVTFSSSVGSTATIRLTDALGRLLMDKPILAQPGTNREVIPLPESMPAGYLVIELCLNDQRVRSLLAVF
jgi:hypothetical protein